MVVFVGAVLPLRPTVVSPCPCMPLSAAWLCSLCRHPPPALPSRSGVLDKIGVEPEVRRIGQYKSAGDQLLRKDMSAAQREQLSALLDDIYDGFVEEVARRRGKKPEEVKSLIDR